MYKFIKILKIVLLIIGAIFILDAGLIFTMSRWQPEVGKADAVVILGAAINTPALTNRTLTALRIYEQGKADTMILSGGKIAESDISEAQFMEKVIIRNTADPVKYVLEDQSHNTYENLKNSKAKLKDVSDRPSIIIVSDKFHLARSYLIAKRLGFKNIYWSSPEADYYSQADLNYYYSREFIAIISYLPRFIFG